MSTVPSGGKGQGGDGFPIAEGTAGRVDSRFPGRKYCEPRIWSCARALRVSAQLPRSGHGCRCWGERLGRRLARVPPPVSHRPAPEGRPPPSLNDEQPSQLHQQPSRLRGREVPGLRRGCGSVCPPPRPWSGSTESIQGRSLGGQRKPGAGGNPGCLVKLSPGHSVSHPPVFHWAEASTRPRPASVDRNT